MPKKPPLQHARLSVPACGFVSQVVDWQNAPTSPGISCCPVKTQGAYKALDARPELAKIVCNSQSPCISLRLQAMSQWAQSKVSRPGQTKLSSLQPHS